MEEIKQMKQIKTLLIFSNSVILKDRHNGKYYIDTQTFSQRNWVLSIGQFIKFPDNVETLIAGKIKLVDNISDIDQELFEINNVAPIYGFFNYKDFSKNFIKISKSIANIVKKSDGILVFVPAPIIHIFAYRFARKYKKLIFSQVTGNPATHPLLHDSKLSGLSKKVSSSICREIIRNSTAIRYETDYTIQNAYPPKKGTPTSAFSSVVLDEVLELPFNKLDVSNIHIISIGTMQTSGKGFDTLIQAISLLKIKYGINITLHLCGDGKNRDGLQSLADSLSVRNQVKFHGHIGDREQLLSKIDDCDFFILPSRTEGKPRVIIEAMSRGKFCIGSDTGGIPELLSDEVIVPINSPTAIVQIVIEAINNPNFYQSEQKRNINYSKRFLVSNNALASKRLEWQKQVISCLFRD